MPNKRRHYRVAQKEIEQSSGLLIKEDDKPKVATFAALLVVVVFLQGLLIGLLLGKDRV